MLSSIRDFDKNYKIEKKIGSGGMGDVYLAIDKRLDRPVAVKVLTIVESLTINNKIEFIERFRHEAKSVAKLSHPNIVAIYDFGNQDDIYYMIMEYLEGSNLTELIRNSKQRIPYTLVVNIAIQICNALQYAHDNQVIHRDVKPDNIILTNNGIVKLTDFGIVLMDKEKESKSNDIIGSVLYSSPEQLYDPSSVDERSDLYSLGVTIYQMLTSGNPFYRDSVSDSVKLIMLEMPESPSEIYPDIPVGLSNLVLKSLAKTPGERFSSIKEMKTALADFADKVTILENNYIQFSDKAENKQDLSKNTIKINNTIVNTTNYRLNLSIGSHGTTEIKKNIQIKNYSWISQLMEIKSGEVLTGVNVKNSINQIISKQKEFSGFIALDNNIFLFFYKGYIIGSLDIANGEMGNLVYKQLPDKVDSLIYKKSENNQLLPVIIFNIISSGLELYKGLNNQNTNLKEFISLLLNSEEKFNGFIEINQQKVPKKKVLYVESDKIAQLLLSKHFKDNDLPFEIFIAVGIVEAKNKINRNNYDLIILDYFLDDGTAKDVMNDFLTIPIILTTSSNEPEVIIEMLKLGIKEYVIKKGNIDYYKEIETAIKNLTGVNKISLNPETYYFAYDNSVPVLSISTETNRVNSVKDNDILSNFSLENCSLSVYTYNTTVLSTSIQLVIRNCSISVGKKDEKISDYRFFTEANEELTLDLENKIKNNMNLKIDLDNDNQLNLTRIISDSLYYKAVKWLTKDYFPLINHSNKIHDMFIIYSNLAEINKVNFFISFSEKEIPIVLYNSLGKPCIFATFGNGEVNNVDSFIENSLIIKKDLDSLEAIIYISTESYNPQTAELFNRYTKNSLLNIFSKKSKYKGIIKTAEGKSVQLNLLNYNLKTDGFDSFLPSLF